MTIVSAVSTATVVSAQATRTVYAPVTVRVEARDLRIAACLQLTERVYPQTPWWERTPADAPAADRAFTSVLAAFKQQDRAALLKLTDPSQSRDTAAFDRQANAFFRQMQSFELLAVPRAYEFDGLVVFFGKFRSMGQTAFVPLTFAFHREGVLAFLPSRSNAPTFRLVRDWFAPTGEAPAETPTYCADSIVNRATHRVALTPATWRPSTLLLTGAPLDTRGPLSDLAAQVRTTIDRMKATLRAETFDEFLKYLTPFGRRQLEEWVVTASKLERDRYRTDFVNQQPFFLFDASPLLIVYTRTPTGEIQVLYFTAADDKQLLWTNPAYLSEDSIFKRGPLLAAAKAAKPFSSLEIK